MNIAPKHWVGAMLRLRGNVIFPRRIPVFPINPVCPRAPSRIARGILMHCPGPM